MDGHHIKQVYAKQLPDGFLHNCSNYLLGDDRIVLRAYNGSDPTHVYTGNLELMKTYVGDYGRMIGTLDSDMIVYAKKISSNNECEVHI